MQITKITKQSGAVVFQPDKYTGSSPYPAIIALTGLGSIGDGSAAALDKVITDLQQGIKDAVDMYGFIVICPQTGASYSYGEIDLAFSILLSQYNVDTNRICGEGFSLGAGGLWAYVRASRVNASKFAAIAPFASTYQVAGSLKNIADAGLPVWAAHNMNDTNGGTPYNATKSQITELSSYPSVIKPAFTGFNLTGHGSWGEMTTIGKIPIPAGSEGMTNPGCDLFQWFLMNELGKPVAVPVAGAQAQPTKPAPSIIHSYQIDIYDDGSTQSKTLK